MANLIFGNLVRIQSEEVPIAPKIQRFDVQFIIFPCPLMRVNFTQILSEKFANISLPTP